MRHTCIYVETLNKAHVGASHFVFCREVNCVLRIWEIEHVGLWSVSFVLCREVFLLCPLLGGPFIGGSTVQCISIVEGAVTLTIVLILLLLYYYYYRTVCISGTGSLIASGSSDLVKIWKKGICLQTLPCGYAVCSCFIPGDRYLLVGTKVSDDLICSTTEMMTWPCLPCNVLQLLVSLHYQ